MGGCASKPKEHDHEALPSEDPATPEQTTRAVEGDAPTTEAVEQPLVDLSESKPEEPSSPKHEELAPGISELKAESLPASAEEEEQAVVVEEVKAEEKKDVATEEQPLESSEKKEEIKA